MSDINKPSDEEVRQHIAFIEAYEERQHELALKVIGAALLEKSERITELVPVIRKAMLKITSDSPERIAQMGYLSLLDKIASIYVHSPEVLGYVLIQIKVDIVIEEIQAA